MDGAIETYVRQIAAIPPALAAAHLPDQVVRSLGGHAHRTGETTWSVALAPGALASAQVEVQWFGSTPSLRITFAPHAGPVPLGRISREPRAWSAAVALPDSGRVPLMRRWTDLPSKVAVSCSAVTDHPSGDPAEMPVHEIVCFVDEP